MTDGCAPIKGWLRRNDFDGSNMCDYLRLGGHPCHFPLLLRAYCTIYSTCQLIIGCCCCTLAIQHTPLQVRMWVWKKATFGSLCLHGCPLGAPTCMASMFPSAAALRVHFRAGQRKSAGGNSMWVFSYSTLTWYYWIDMRWKIDIYIYPITTCMTWYISISTM